jgi:hypothetical protein
MSKKNIIIIGIVAVAAIAAFFVLNTNRSGNITQDLQNPIKKEMSVGTDVCAEFPKEWVESVRGKTITKVEPFNSSGTYTCKYYVDENNFITLRLNNLSAENQKKGQESLGRTITTNSAIKMNHFFVIQEDGLINGIYLVINPNLFIAVDRNSTKAASEDELTNFAVKVAERIQRGENVATATSDKTSPTDTSESAIPLLQGEDIVRNFFNLIDEGKTSEAVNMLTPINISNDSAKQAWGVQFNAFEKITVKKIEVAGEPAENNTYKVTLDVEMKPEAENAQPMPYYGWGNGEFVRWITLEKVDNVWKIAGIATSP